MARVLQGVVSQRLIPRRDGGLVAAVEVMVTNARVAELIRESRAEDMHDAIEEGAFHDMQSFQQALVGLVIGGEVERDVAARSATNRHDLLLAVDHALKQQAAPAPAPEPEPEQPPDDAPWQPAAPQLRVAR